MPARKLPEPLLLLVGLVLFVWGCGPGAASGPADVAPDERVDATAGDGAGPPDALPDAAPDAAPDADAPPADGDAGDVPAAADADAAPAVPYPTSELVLAILDPAPDGHAESVSATTDVRGVVFGAQVTVNWQTDSGQSGQASGVPFFQTGVIRLNRGDNVVIVTARQGNAVTTRRIVITHNPAFRFDGPFTLRPDVVFVGERNELVATVATGRYTDFAPETLHLWECAPDGAPRVDLGQLRDDGAIAASGDEVQGDGVYSLRFPVSFSAATTAVYRAAVQVVAADAPYTAHSRPATLDVVARVGPADCRAMLDLQRSARAAWLEALPNDGETPARAAALAVLRASPLVAEAGGGVGPEGVWAAYRSGVLGALPLAPAGTRGGGDVSVPPPGVPAPLPAEPTGSPPHLGSRRVLLFDPLGTSTAQDEVTGVSQALAARACPPYEPRGPLWGEAATLAELRQLGRYGLVVVAALGGVYFATLSEAERARFAWAHAGAQEVLFTGEPVDCDAWASTAEPCSPGSCPAGSDCVLTGAVIEGGLPRGTGVCVPLAMVDLLTGRAVLGDDSYGVLPAFFTHHLAATSLPDSLVYLGASQSAYNGTLFAALLGRGARTVVGYAGRADTALAALRGRAFFDTALSGVGGLEAGLAAARAINAVGSHVLVLGALDLDLEYGDLLNGDFQEGLHGWTAEGDARLVARLGSAAPPTSRAMAFLTTGLGVETRSATLRQRVCVPAGRVDAVLRWRLYSEEFPENCGSAYQDRFVAELVASHTTAPLVDAWVDALCPPGSCAGCGAQFESLEPADVGFDVGDVQRTGWIESRASVAALAGQGPADIVLTVSDRGDSRFDTGVLVDELHLR